MIPARRNWAMFLLSLFLTLVTAALRAQDSHFEVASIRPTETGKQPVTNLDLDASGYFRYHGGPILANGLLVNYIIFAYNIENASLYPAINAQLPGWAQTQRFYVEARAAVEQPSKDDLRVMMRGLLEDRFDLRVRTELREQKVYALRLNPRKRDVTQLRPHTDEPICGTRTDTTAKQESAQPSVPAPTCGTRAWDEPDGNMHLRILDYSMQQIAGELSYVALRFSELNGLPVVDETHLEGHFDLNITFAKPARSADPIATADPDRGPTFLSALADQAGLILKPAVAPVETLVVSQVRELSPN